MLTCRAIAGVLTLMVLVAPSAFADDAVPAVPGLAPLVKLLGQVDDPAVQADVLRGVSEAVKGRRRVAMPEGWAIVYPKLRQSANAEVRYQALALSLVFGDQQALESLRKTLSDPKAKPAAR